MNPAMLEAVTEKAQKHAQEILYGLVRKSLHDMERNDENKIEVNVTVEIKRVSGALQVKAKGTGQCPLKHKDDTVPEKVGDGMQMEMEFDEQVKTAVKKAVKRANRKAGAK